MITPNDFIQAARAGDKEVVAAYIAENVHNPAAINIKYVDRYKSGLDQYREESALFHAVMVGKLDIVLMLLEIPGIDVNAAFIAAAERPLYNTHANMIRNHIFRKKKKILSHKELCQAYTSKQEFSVDFKPEYDISMHYLYEKYLQLDKIHNVTKSIFTAILAKNPSQESLDQALLKADDELIDILVEAGASLAPWERMSAMPQTSKDRYLHLLAILPLMENQIQYIQDNLDQQDITVLDEIIFSFANLLATRKKYASAAHSLYEVAADMNHERAQRIVSKFSQSPKANLIPSLQSLCTQTLWKNRQRLKQESMSRNNDTLSDEMNSDDKTVDSNPKPSFS